VRLYIILAIVLAIGTAGFVGYKYVSNLQQTIAEQRENMAIMVANEQALQGALKTQKLALESVQKDNKLKDAILADVVDQFNDTRALVRDQEDRLNEVDISSLGQQDAAAVQQIINKRTANLSRCFEVATGSPLTPADQTGNPECPTLIPRVQGGPQ
jgi:hypothetical protein